MKLSFVIPAYNEEKIIGKCLDSVCAQAQKYPGQVEIIVVNNASTDHTKQIASQYKQVRVVDEPRKGLVHARHAGYLASSGELIANVDSDTILTSGWLDRVFKEFSANPRLVGLSGPFKYYDLPKRITRLIAVFYYIGYGVYLLNRFVFRTGSMLQGGNFVVTRTGLEKIGGFDTSIEFYGEDADIARRLHKVGDVKFTSKLPMYSTGRRLAAEGIFTMANRYAMNYFWMIFLKKPKNTTYHDIRPQDTINGLINKSNRTNHEVFAKVIMFSVLGTIFIGGGLLVYVVASDVFTSAFSISEAKAAIVTFSHKTSQRIHNTIHRLDPDDKN